jgi:hypothetical protein
VISLMGFACVPQCRKDSGTRGRFSKELSLGRLNARSNAPLATKNEATDSFAARYSATAARLTQTLQKGGCTAGRVAN